MLERVPLLDKHLDDYQNAVDPGTLERIRDLAAPLAGKRVLHVNATAYGGGVAELLAAHVALLRDLGIEAEWQVIHGSDEFFAVTKNVHNTLQGADIEWTSAMEHIYLERVLDNALQLEGDWDYVVIHDPQPAAMLEYPRNQGVAHTSTKWIWRCHIDLTEADAEVWNFFQPFVEQYDAVGVDDAGVRSREHAARSGDLRAAVHRPALGEEPRAATVRGGDHAPIRRPSA